VHAGQGNHGQRHHQLQAGFGHVTIGGGQPGHNGKHQQERQRDDRR